MSINESFIFLFSIWFVYIPQSREKTAKITQSSNLRRIFADIADTFICITTLRTRLPFVLDKLYTPYSLYSIVDAHSRIYTHLPLALFLLAMRHLVVVRRAVGHARVSLEEMQARVTALGRRAEARGAHRVARVACL